MSKKLSSKVLQSRTPISVSVRTPLTGTLRLMFMYSASLAASFGKSFRFTDYHYCNTAVEL